MKKIALAFLFLCILVQAGFAGSGKKMSKFDFTGPNAPSLIRGFNYTPSKAAFPREDMDGWIRYDSATIEFDLNLAKSLNLNQVRVFVPYAVYTEDKKDLPARLRQFVRECYKKNIGVMAVVGSGPWLQDTTLRPQAREWVRFLVKAISNEPGLKMWDVMNEPDWPTSPKELVVRKTENAKFMARIFHELDHNTPVTIGWAFVDGMIECAGDVDVLQFHDYSPTREQIRNNIMRAKEFATKVHKPLIDGEIGCVARANPYDVTLQEHMKAKVGWYIWELMIVRKGWGPVQGVFYEDGTVRDPSIPAAILGFFRKRSGDILPSVPDREGWVSRTIDRSEKWLNDATRTWKDGLDIAEIEANLLEAGQLTAMRIPPTWEVEMLRQGEVNIEALKKLIIKFRGELEPYKIQQAQGN
ncbi:MAG: glycoside hydrolase family 2 TIM barrel-domain containing protein [Candidatus Kryptoniota bacterium]